MWSQFGKPRPPPPYLNFSAEDCSAFGVRNVTQNFNPLVDGREVYIEKAVAQESG